MLMTGDSDGLVNMVNMDQNGTIEGPLCPSALGWVTVTSADNVWIL